KERMGSGTITDQMLDNVPDLARFTAHVKDAGFKKALFVGSPGIRPAVEVYSQAFSSPGGIGLTTVNAEDALEMQALSPDTLVILAGKTATAPNVKAAFQHL